MSSSNTIIEDNSEIEDSKVDDRNQKNVKEDPGDENEDVTPPPLPPPRHSRIELTTPPPPQLPPRDKRASSVHETTSTTNATTNMNSAINNQTPQKKKRKTTALSNVSRFLFHINVLHLLLLNISKRKEKICFHFVVFNTNSCLVYKALP